MTFLRPDGLALVALLATAACASSQDLGSGPGADGGGGRAGLDETASIATLSDPQRTQLCDWSIQQYGGPGRTVQCPGGRTNTTDTVGHCLDTTPTYASCGIVVSQFEDCVLAIAGDLCASASTLPAACQPLANCVSGGGP
jgi:hypothetical protein